MRYIYLHACQETTAEINVPLRMGPFSRLEYREGLIPIISDAAIFADLDVHPRMAVIQLEIGILAGIRYRIKIASESCLREFSY